MNGLFFGELSCKRVPYSKPLRRHVEKRISEWVSGQNVPDFPKSVTYQVTLEREAVGHTVNCQVTVAAKEAWWSGYSWGRTPEDALAQALSRMTRLSIHPLRPETRASARNPEPQIAS